MTRVDNPFDESSSSIAEKMRAYKLLLAADMLRDGNFDLLMSSCTTCGAEGVD